LVGVGDSGLDVRSCWLADPEMDEPGPRHRKIQRYNALWGDDVDGNGHGTHVVSTILGEAVAWIAERRERVRRHGAEGEGPL